MDPNATVDRIVEAFGSGDAEEGLAALEDLREWLRRGGFPPDEEHQRRLDDALKTIGA